MVAVAVLVQIHAVAMLLRAKCEKLNQANIVQKKKKENVDVVRGHLDSPCVKTNAPGAYANFSEKGIN